MLWGYVKVEGELIGQPWLLNDSTGGLVALPLVCVCGGGGECENSPQDPTVPQ